MKTRRALVTAAAAAALVLAPSAAFGYGAENYQDKGTVSDSTPAAGEAFKVTVKGPAKTNVTLTVTTPGSVPVDSVTIAGTKSFTKLTDAAGNAVFSVTLAQPGTFSLVVTDAASGAVLSTQAVTVAGAAAAAGTPAALSSTGSNALPIAAGAGALLA
ncbi:peptidase, partial [Cellulomonas septica]